ncbi:MAG: UvrD-helicase domain-containing protein [Gemmatimonadota bacterium]
MSGSVAVRARPPDQGARDRIVEQLELNFLVEAGAGSGKTTALAARMVALVATGTARPDEIAAVTFTRKAAAELRERFREDLEKAMRSTGQAQIRSRLAHALTQVDRAFLGTIHAFAARLLRERPLEAGLDPGFRELQENEEARLRRQFWNDHLERLATDGDPGLLELSRVGIQPQRLHNAFQEMSDNLDLEFPAPEVPAPTEAEVALLRVQLDGLLDRAQALMPEREPSKGWGEVQRKVERALHARKHRDWERTEAFLNHLYAFSTGTTRITLNRWEPDSRAQGPIKALRDDIVAFTAKGGREGEEVGPAHAALRRWWAHRYPTAVRFVRRAAEAYAAERRRLGLVSFQDLLLLTAELLRRSPSTRRDLGRRFRYLLIDEFQDTDPVQAEIAFLLASEPDSEEPADSQAWRLAVPRPGALFVVGDPKQSIYRFRRADIAVYEQVRARFAAFGEVLRLNANFRSLLEIAAIANEVFSERFGQDQPPVQARFEPLLPQRPFAEEVVASRGIGWYAVDLKGGEGETREDRVRDEAERLAGWIRYRVDAGERSAGDFLVLTRVKRNLSHFARALEARGLPIEVAGAGVGTALELDELRLLLRALTDPGNDVLIAAALTGLFFGVDHEELVQHRLGGGRLDLWEPGREDGVVAEALRALRDLWTRSQAQPADVFIAALVERTGLLPHAAAGELGSLRTGVLAYALDAVRAAAVAGDTSLVGALDALETALAWEEAEAPLRPGASDAVRIMNLHKAKGLEAPVVILADPGSGGTGSRSLHVQRDETGVGRAWFTVTEREGWNTVPLAQPEGWPEMADLETRYDKAEQERLLYVSATRARDELVIALGQNGRADREAWRVFSTWSQEHATLLELPLLAPGGRMPLEEGAAALAAAARRAGERRARGGTPTVRFHSVTQQAKSSDEETEPALDRAIERATGPRGYEWGSVVHGTLAAAARGRSLEELRAVGSDLLREYERPVDDAGRPTELAELLGLVERVRGSDLWRRSERAAVRHVEVPVAVPLDGEREGDGPVVLEGVVDLAFREANGWVVVDYKTDSGDDPDFPVRSGRYRRQVELYAHAWALAVGEPVVERAVYYTTRDVVDSF